MPVIQVMPPPWSSASVLGHVSEPGWPGSGSVYHRHWILPVSGSTDVNTPRMSVESPETPAMM